MSKKIPVFKLQEKYKDIIAGVACLIVSVWMFVLTFNIKRLTVSRIGSEFVPRIVFSLLILLSLTLIVQGIINLSKHKKGLQQDTKENLAATPRHSLYLTILLITMYIVLLKKVGFLITTAFYLFFQFLVLAEKDRRRYGLFALIAVLTSSIIYFLFYKVFQLMLPRGLLG
ncbi:MAG: tripartite tricarboxylate transporter TctB family protein [Clostridia bacterium]